MQTIEGYGTELYSQLRWYTLDRDDAPSVDDIVVGTLGTREKQRKAEEERHHLRDAFMSRDLQPDVMERLSRAVKGAAERGERELLVLRFSSEYCTDRGRAINSLEPEWPQTLTGFAKRAHEFWQAELEPKGYKLRAQIMDFPGGMPGDVGMFLTW